MKCAYRKKERRLANTIAAIEYRSETTTANMMTNIKWYQFSRLKQYHKLTYTDKLR